MILYIQKLLPVTEVKISGGFKGGGEGSCSATEKIVVLVTTIFSVALQLGRRGRPPPPPPPAVPVKKFFLLSFTLWEPRGTLTGYR